MKKEQMVGARLSSELVRELELIEDAEQSDRSTIVRRLLSQGSRGTTPESGYGVRRQIRATKALS